MKTIILCFSYTGNNKMLASSLQKRLGCDMEEIIEVRKRSGLTMLLDILFSRMPAIHPLHAQLAMYDLVLFVAPIWNAKIASPVRSLIKMEKHNLGSFAFISLCAGRQGQTDKIYSELAELSHEEPLAVKELALTDLVKSDGQDRSVSTHKLREEELHFFEPAIRSFLTDIGAIPSVQREEAVSRS